MKPKTKKQLMNILIFAKRAQKRTNGVTIEAFLTDEFLQDAVLYCLGQVGETAANIPIDEQNKYPDLLWRQMIGLRNRLFHDYEEIDLSRIFAITQEPISLLIQNLELLLNVNV